MLHQQVRYARVHLVWLHERPGLPPARGGMGRGKTNASFGRHFSLIRSFYQDRLGTDTGKTQHRDAFSCRTLGSRWEGRRAKRRAMVCLGGSGRARLCSGIVEPATAKSPRNSQCLSLSLSASLFGATAWCVCLVELFHCLIPIHMLPAIGCSLGAGSGRLLLLLLLLLLQLLLQ